MMNQMMAKLPLPSLKSSKKRVDISPPEVLLINYNDGPSAMPDFSTSAAFLRIGFSLKIGDVAETGAAAAGQVC